jgi:cell division protein FtsB
MDKAYYREMWEETREELKLVDEENKDLKAENIRLKADIERLSKPAIVGGYNISEYIRMANSETLEFDNGDIFAGMTLPERIKYIVESHARLKAEVERLTSDIQMEKENEDRLVREWQKANNEVYGLKTQVAALIDDQTRLKTEVERLTNLKSTADQSKAIREPS